MVMRQRFARVGFLQFKKQQNLYPAPPCPPSPRGLQASVFSPERRLIAYVRPTELPERVFNQFAFVMCRTRWRPGRVPSLALRRRGGEFEVLRILGLVRRDFPHSLDGGEEVAIRTEDRRLL